MQNPVYADDFQREPHPDRIAAFTGINHAQPILSAGVKTITHNRAGFQLHAHKVVVIEMTDGDQTFSFDLNASFARAFANSLLKYANEVE